MDVFLTSPWIPAEWIRAHGLMPRGVWGAPDFKLEALPQTAGACAWANAVVGLAESRADAAVVFSTHCDQLRRGFDTACGVPPGPAARIFLYNLPATWQTAAAEQLVQDELRRLGTFLESLGGSRPSDATLRDVMHSADSARRQLLAAAPRCSARAFAEAVDRFHWEGVIALPVPEEQPAGAVPLALVGGPLSRAQWHLFEILEAAGGRVVLNATEGGERSLAAPRIHASHPFDELAARCLARCADVFQRPNTPLYEWLGARLAPRGVRGLVLWHYVGCDLWLAEGQSLREAFQLPVLPLDAEEVAGDAPRTRNRLEAFVETLS